MVFINAPPEQFSHATSGRVWCVVFDERFLA
jgi:hypothetical protein